jgi:hypothetical protein
MTRGTKGTVRIGAPPHSGPDGDPITVCLYTCATARLGGGVKQVLALQCWSRIDSTLDFYKLWQRTRKALELWSCLSPWEDLAVGVVAEMVLQHQQLDTAWLIAQLQIVTGLQICLSPWEDLAVGVVDLPLVCDHDHGVEGVEPVRVLLTGDAEDAVHLREV